MGLFITILVILLILFCSFYTFIHYNNKKETEDEKMSILMTVFVSSMLSLAVTVVFALILFSILGVTNFINMSFSLDIGMKSLMILAIAFLVYLFTVDSLIEMIIKVIVGKKFLYYVLVLLARIGAFHWIGSFIGLEQTVRFIIAVCVAFIIMIIEVLYDRNEKSKHT